jgi:TetR/AcrR family transcriptional regulator, cholesterol catabolism regulator
MNTRERILNVGTSILLERGYRAVTTALIAKEARISKNTLYAIFPNKDELLEAIIFSFIAEGIAQWDRLEKGEESAMEKLLVSLRFLSEFVPRIQANLISQIENVDSVLWAKIDDLRRERLQRMKRLLVQVQEKGYIRSDIDPEQWMLMLLATVGEVLNPKTLFQTGYTLPELMRTITLIYYHGLLTDEGKKYVEEKEKS